MLISSQRDAFDIPENIAYLNCAYMSPLMNKVVEAGKKGVGLKGRPWRLTPADFFSVPDEIRLKCAKMIGAAPADIALVPSVSYGIACATNNIPLEPGQEIICLEDQFPSNIYPWRRMADDHDGTVRMISEQDARTGNGHTDWTTALLNTIGNKTAIVALPHCHWTNGAVIDLVRVGEKARAHGAALVLDITQSCGALPIDVNEVQPDFLVCASYKWLLGPYSTGFVYVSPKWQNGRPLEEGWITRKGSEDFRRLVDYQDDYQPGAVRFDMGERSNFHLMPMMDTALGQLLEWGVENIAETLLEKTRYIAAKVASLGLEAPPEELRAGHFLGLRVPGGIPDTLLPALVDEDIYVSVRGDSIRVTPHLYNTTEDADRLVAALKQNL
jgi:selenocysteine lyase/cysteine desulfurase